MTQYPEPCEDCRGKHLLPECKEKCTGHWKYEREAAYKEYQGK